MFLVLYSSPSVQWIPKSLLLGVMWPMREADRSSVFTAKLRIRVTTSQVPSVTEWSLQGQLILYLHFYLLSCSSEKKELLDNGLNRNLRHKNTSLRFQYINLNGGKCCWISWNWSTKTSELCGFYGLKCYWLIICNLVTS